MPPRPPRKRAPLDDNGRPARCRYCDRILEPSGCGSRTAATRDHFMPKALGGRHTVWCCAECNHKKDLMHPEEWFAWMAANPNWWRRKILAPTSACGIVAHPEGDDA